MSEILLLDRRSAPHPRAVPSPVAPPHPAAEAQTAALAPPVAATVVRPVPPSHLTPVHPPAFAPRNSPVDLLFRGLWQLVGAYVFVVLLVKDRRVPR